MSATYILATGFQKLLFKGKLVRVGNPVFKLLLLFCLSIHQIITERRTRLGTVPGTGAYYAGKTGTVPAWRLVTKQCCGCPWEKLLIEDTGESRLLGGGGRRIYLGTNWKWPPWGYDPGKGLKLSNYLLWSHWLFLMATWDWFLTFEKLESSLKTWGSPVTHHHMDDPWGYYANWNKPVAKRQYCKVPLIRGI